MKIRDRFAAEERTFSFEFFPPKTPEGTEKLVATARRLAELAPSFVSVTYGAGGSTRTNTIDLTARLQDELGLVSMAHLTCVGHTSTELSEILAEIAGRGIENLICLRGDPPTGETQFRAAPGGFANAAELVLLARANGDFSIAVAGYPEGHQEATSRDDDLRHLRTKVDAGADFVITQLFFEAADYFAFVERARRGGIQARIVPGVMPALSVGQIRRMAARCGASVPGALAAALAAAGDPERAAAVGTEWAMSQCEALLRGGAPGIHFYTLNQSTAVETIFAHLRATVARLLPR